VTQAPLLVRADTGPEIGMGHAMRCLAVAQAWRGRGAPCVLWAHADTLSGFATRLRDEGIETVHLEAERGSLDDARRVAEVAVARRAAWTLVDGYRFDAPYQEVLAGAGSRVAWMDDCGRLGSFHADLVVNPNAAASEEWYARRQPRTRVLLGPRYAPLRREFVDRAPSPRPFSGVARRLLISLGGADPDNATLPVVRAAARAGREGLEVRVIVGPVNPHAAALRAAASRGVEIIENVPDMSEALAWADMAVIGAGGTLWEALSLGVPALLVVVAEDQRGNASELQRLGVCRALGEGRGLDESSVAAVIGALAGEPEERRAMSERGRALVDGRGASRIVAAMREEEISLRRARREDEQLLLRWANDPAARAASFSTGAIAPADHVRWLASKLADPDCAFFVATTGGGEPIGTVRFDREGSAAVVSTTVDPAWRGRGYAAALIRSACREYFAGFAAGEAQAFIKEDNEPSRRAFLAAGFRENGWCERGGAPAQRLVLARSQAMA
jgi:UDP-2,4-diacetamido-2,4,6-trideoxy-beta-L-altropyranose hydrolase